MISLPSAVRIGSQKPRVSSYPEYVTSSGDDAIDLAAIAGLELDPWQGDHLRGALGETEEGKWTATEVGLFVPRQNGKGSVIEARVLAGLFLFGEMLISWTAHEYKTAAEGYLRIKSLIKNTPELDDQVRIFRAGAGEQGIELKECKEGKADQPCRHGQRRHHDGQRLRFLARSAGSGRGFTGELVILDEAQFLSALEIKALYSTLSAKQNPQIWYLGTPPSDPAAWIYGLKEDGEAGRPGLAWADWGLKPLDIDDPYALIEAYGDIELAYLANPALGIRLSESFCEKELRRLKIDYGQERLGIWHPKATAGAGVISTDQWSGQHEKALERPADVVLAVVTDHKRRYTAIVAVGKHPSRDGLLLSIVDYRAGTAWVVERLVQLKKRVNPLVIVIQDKGPTGSLLEDMAKAGLTTWEKRADGVPSRGDIVIPWADDVADAYGMFVDGVVQQRIWHLNEGPLNGAIEATDTRSLSGATAWEYKGTVDASPLIGATLGVWGYETYAHIVIDPYDPLANIW